MSWYRTGTVAVTNGSPTVTGTGTAFVGAVDSGEGFIGPDGKTYEVLAVVSATVLTLATNYAGATASGQAYQIEPIRGRINELNANVSALLTRYANLADKMDNGAFGNGTAAAPSINFGSDSDTGTYRIAANQLGFAAGGVLRAKIDADGINTYGPYMIASHTVWPIMILEKTGVGTWKMTANDSTNAFTLNLNAAAPFLTVGTDGAVIVPNALGIGTTTPNVKLHLKAPAEIFRFETTTARGGGNSFFTFFDPTGRKAFVGYGGSSDDFYISNDLAGDILFQANGTERVRFTGAGYVGIGTAAPSHKFHVAGIARATNFVSIVSDNPTTLSTGYSVAYTGDNAFFGRTGSAFVTQFGWLDADRNYIYSSGEFRIGNSTGYVGLGGFLTTTGNACIGGTNADIFGRGYGRTLGITGVSTSALEINAATGNASYLDMGVNAVRTFGIAVDIASISLSAVTNIPMLFSTNATERMRITAGGGLLFRATTGSAASVASTSAQFSSEILSRGSTAGVFWEDRVSTVTSTTNWHGWYATGGTIFLFNGTGNIASINPSTGVYAAISDAARKRDIIDNDTGLDAILALRPVSYKMLDSEETEIGLIAQEVEEVIPAAVRRSIYDNADGEAQEFVGLNDRPIIAALINAVKTLHATNLALTARIEALETE